MTPAHDAIVVGAGPAGATAALLLARAGWQVALVEKTPFPRRKVCGDFISAPTWPLLQGMGLAAALTDIAGPVVRRIGFFAGSAMLAEELANAGGQERGGRAVPRELLDALLLARSLSAGVRVWQPWKLASFAEHEGEYACTLVEAQTGRSRTLRTRLVIAAHGSWEHGPMPTQGAHHRPGAGSLFAFKALLRNSSLAPGLMPLLAFPGGYGGLVHTGVDHVGLSCCIRHDRLRRCRQEWPAATAGEAVLAHIERSCEGVSRALASATVEGAWLASGPLRTGLHGFGHGGLFAIGNAAAEAHPVVAEGISMAIQSAALLCGHLIAHPLRPPDLARSADALADVRRRYAIAWREAFSARLRLAALLAHVCMRPAGARLAAAVLARFPHLLATAARWSGKGDPPEFQAGVAARP